MSTQPTEVTYEQIRDAYLARYPAPEPLWFRCPRCKALPGQPCRGRLQPGKAHAPRQDQCIRAHRLRSLDSANYTDNRFNEIEGIAFRHITDRHLRYMRRVGARITTKES